MNPVGKKCDMYVTFNNAPVSFRFALNYADIAYMI